MVEISDADFERLVDEAMDLVPEEAAAYMDNVVLFVADDPPPEEPDLLGVYDGIPLTERDGSFGFVPPDTIFLFKNNLKDFARDLDELREEILVTIMHEIAHHFGIDDDRLHELGWG